MKGLIRLSATISVLALLASAQLHAEEAIFSVGETGKDKLHWQTYSSDLSDQQYRRISRQNQRQLRNFAKSYTENKLLSMGVPETGIKVMGVAAALAANRNTTLYLNKNHFLALEFKDVTNDNRAMFFGFKVDW